MGAADPLTDAFRKFKHSQREFQARVEKTVQKIVFPLRKKTLIE